MKAIRIMLLGVVALLGGWSSMSLAKVIPQAPELDAKAYVLLDAASGDVIVGHNEHEALPPASLTKIMTVFVVMNEILDGNLSEDEKVHISKKAWRTGGSRMFVDVNTQVPLSDLLKGVIIQSGNDASVAMAEHVAGTETAFANVMNSYAERLGMENSQFANSTGLPADDNYSSAYDMAILAKASIDRSPEHYALYKQKSFKWNNIEQPNRNTLLSRDPSVDGMKTGYIQAAGYCLVASALRDGRRMIAVVMGSKSPKTRAAEASALMNYGFRHFETVELVTENKVLETQQVYKGASDQVELGVLESVIKSLPKDKKRVLTTEVVIDEPLTAPINVGDTLGNVRVLEGDEVLYETPLLALSPVEEGGFFTRIWDALMLFIMGLFA